MVGFKAWLLEQENPIKIALPAVHQSSNYDCGAASLRSIASYFGFGPETEQQFIKAVKATKDNGTEPKNLIRAAKSFGLKVLAKENMSIQELIAMLDKGKPVICDIQAWGEPKEYKTKNSGHYVVAIGYDDKHIYFEDPSMKVTRGKLTYDDFIRRWHDKDINGKPFKRLGIVVWANQYKKKPKIS